MSAQPSAGATEQALLHCADEPIAVPGAIQPHGVLLAMEEPALTVVSASANAAALFGGPVLGRTLAELLDAGDLAELRAGVARDLGEVNPLRQTLGGEPVDLVLHRRDGLLIGEWEPLAGARVAADVWHARLAAVLARLSESGSLEELTAALARDVRALTGFDRVMV